jgi:hypothetical protein
VAIVSSATAHAFWPGADPIGRTFGSSARRRPVEEIPGYTEVTVVGVAGDVVSGSWWTARRRAHLPADQLRRSARRARCSSGRAASATLGPDALQEIFRRASPRSAGLRGRPARRDEGGADVSFRAAAFVGSALGAIALVLSVAGLYGVLAFTLSQRTREIGIRMALGATAGAVVRLVMAQSARLAGIGALIGLASRSAAMKVLSALVTLHEVSFLEPRARSRGTLVVACDVVAAVSPRARDARRSRRDAARRA